MKIPRAGAHLVGRSSGNEPLRSTATLIAEASVLPDSPTALSRASKPNPTQALRRLRDPSPLHRPAPQPAPLERLAAPRPGGSVVFVAARLGRRDQSHNREYAQRRFTSSRASRVPDARGLNGGSRGGRVTNTVVGRRVKGVSHFRPRSRSGCRSLERPGSRCRRPRPRSGWRPPAHSELRGHCGRAPCVPSTIP